MGLSPALHGRRYPAAANARFRCEGSYKRREAQIKGLRAKIGNCVAGLAIPIHHPRPCFSACYSWEVGYGEERGRGF